MNTFKLQDKKIENLYRLRLMDIKERGGDFSVYNRDGSVVELKKADVWSDDNGNYFKPISSQEIYCLIN